MERLQIEESTELLHLASLLCQSGYFFPVADSKSLVVKDDGGLYRFQVRSLWVVRCLRKGYIFLDTKLNARTPD